MKASQIARVAIEAMLDRRGYALKDKALPPRGLKGFTQNLKNGGFVPGTIIDVGVGYGTPWLYDEFPDARFELFEALDLFVPAMERICTRLDARYHLTALGSEPGTLRIDVNRETPTSSTMSGFSRVHSPIIRSGRLVTIEPRMVLVRRLDEFGPFEPPVLLKIDVEGFEMDVLRGATETLAKTEVLITEVSVAKRHVNDVSFGTFMAYVESLGFALIDIPELAALNRNGPLAYLDAAFRKSMSGADSG